MNEPSGPPPHPALEQAIAAATLAGQRIARLFGQAFSVGRKQVNGQSQGLVTQADLEAEQVIIETIGRRFPDHQFLSEESHPELATSAEHLWILDPLDGTNNFAFGIPHFSV